MANERWSRSGKRERQPKTPNSMRNWRGSIYFSLRLHFNEIVITSECALASSKHIVDVDEIKSELAISPALQWRSRACLSNWNYIAVVVCVCVARYSNVFGRTENGACWNAKRKSRLRTRFPSSSTIKNYIYVLVRIIVSCMAIWHPCPPLVSSMLQQSDIFIRTMMCINSFTFQFPASLTTSSPWPTSSVPAHTAMQQKI